MSPDALARHLATLLSIADLAGRLAPQDDGAQIGSDLVHLARRAASADRASLFQIDNADADDETPPWIVRLARDVAEPDGVPAVVPFQPAHVALLFAPLASGATQALGPIGDAEPFYARHRSEEPRTPRYAAFAAVVVAGRARGVVEIARDEAAFRGDELLALDAAARAIAAGVWGTRRESTIAAFLAGLLPEVLSEDRAMTSLPDRVREWLAARALDPTEREAIQLAATIAELAQSSDAALGLVHTVLSATRKAMVSDVRGWSEASRAR